MNRKERRAAAKRKARDGGAGGLVVGNAGKASKHRAEGREALLTLGRQLHEQGRLQAADRYYVQALQADPDDAEALRLRGALALQIGNHEAAAGLLRRAVKHLPEDAEVHLHLAAALEGLGPAKEAERVYRKAVTLAPGDAGARMQLGAFLRLSGDLAAAEPALREARALDPGHAASAYHLAALLIQAGRGAEAVAHAEAAHASEPGDADILIVLGVARQHAGDFAGAEAAFRWVDRLKPGNLGAAINLASLLVADGRLAEAETAARAAVEAAPESVPALLNLGVVLTAMERFEEGEAIYRRVLDHAPDHAEAWGNHANLFRMAGRHEEAETAYRRALALDPEGARHRFQLGMGLLALGRLEEGWALYEHGFACGERRPNREPDAARWQGERLETGRLHIWPEQGVGDEIRFLGLVGEAAARAGGETLVECDARLLPLARRSFPAITFAATDAVAARDGDRRIPMGSLAAMLRARGADFPDHAGYLEADPAARADFAERLAALGPGLKVGIAWRSGLTSSRRDSAHGPLDDWAPILTMAGVRPVSLQYGDVEGEVARAEAAHGIHIARWPDLDLRQDLDRVAALIAELDLVIATGSSVCDLAGALGTPLWALYRPRDWVMLGTDGTPWYPRARVFCRRPGEGWARLIAEAVAPALAGLRDRG